VRKRVNTMAQSEVTTVPQLAELPSIEPLAEVLDKITPDCHQPAKMVHQMESSGVAKAARDTFSMVLLGLLAGFFIGLGAVFCTLVTTNSGLGFGLAKLLGGLVFCLGLILVVVAGAELFTGNCLMVAPWMSTRISKSQLLRNLGIVYASNLAGSLILVALVFYAQSWALNGYAFGANALTIANAKVNLAFVPALFRGILCNILVCLAVWLCFAARSVPGKVLAILFPITAFVACGFEHSIANMYFIPMGIVLAGQAEVVQAAGVAAGQLASLNLLGFLHNLVPVTLGNIIGGSAVGAVYWLVFLRKERAAEVVASRRWLRRFVAAPAQPGKARIPDLETALLSVLAKARDDSAFLAQLSQDPEQALAGYQLPDAARAALASGDVSWLESRIGKLDEPLRTWFTSRLSQEKW
jgi:formate transporter